MIQEANDILQDIIRNAKVVATEASELLQDTAFTRTLAFEGRATDYAMTLRGLRDDAERLSASIQAVSSKPFDAL